MNFTQFFILVFFLYALFGFFETLAPVVRGQTTKGRLRNFGFLCVFIFIGGIFSTMLREFFAIDQAIVDNPSIAMTAGLALLSLFATDFFFYWYHRLAHVSKTIWPIHELHHSDAELNVTSGLRTHWLENPLQALIITAPVTFLVGTSSWLAFVLPIVQLFWLFFTHANIKLHFGILTPVIVGPQLHRIHHSVERELQFKNYAQYFPIFDILFGSYYRPKKDEYPVTGAKSMDSNVPILRAAIQPFRTWFLRKEVN